MPLSSSSNQAQNYIELRSVNKNDNNNNGIMIHSNKGNIYVFNPCISRHIGFFGTQFLYLSLLFFSKKISYSMPICFKEFVETMLRKKDTILHQFEQIYKWEKHEISSALRKLVKQNAHFFFILKNDRKEWST